VLALGVAAAVLVLAFVAFRGFLARAGSHAPTSPPAAGDSRGQPRETGGRQQPAVGEGTRAGARSGSKGAGPASNDDGAKDTTRQAKWGRHKRGLQRALDAYLETNQYPPDSRPPDDPNLHSVLDRTLRVDMKDDSGKSMNKRQDKYYVYPGDSAVVSVESGNDAAIASVADGELMKLEGKPEAPSSPIGGAPFRDDGRAPDEVAGDGRFTARIEFPEGALEDYSGMLLFASTSPSLGPTLPIEFRFLCTGPAPARFTGRLREEIRDGSLVLHMGVRIEKEGPYLFVGRLFDADDRLVALMQQGGKLDPKTTEIDFEAFGKLLLDQKAKAPFSVRDVEGWMILTEGEVGARLVIPTWTGPYRTKNYPEGTFSDAEWESAEKESTVEAMRRQIEEAPE
jgi:hypothetical protein